MTLFFASLGFIIELLPCLKGSLKTKKLHKRLFVLGVYLVNFVE